MNTNFDNIIPAGIIFTLKEIEDFKIIKISTAKKLIYAGKLEATRIGNKLHVTRSELIRYLQDGIVKREGI